MQACLVVLFFVNICEMFEYCIHKYCWYIKRTSVARTLHYVWGILALVCCRWFLLYWQICLWVLLLLWFSANRGVVPMATELVVVLLCHFSTPPLNRPASLPIYTKACSLLIWLWYYLWKWIKKLIEIEAPCHLCNFYTSGEEGKNILAHE